MVKKLVRKHWWTGLCVGWTVVGLTVGAPLFGSEIWPGFRGHGAAVGELPESFELEPEWNRELGSGYSSLVAAGGLVLTLFTAGEDDVLGAFDGASGEERWRLRLGPKYEGHDGSDDGPLSTPAVADGRVFALGPRGRLVAASLADGKELWQVQLDESNSTVPEYGYTSSPLPVDDLVVIQVGGKGRTVVAYDAETGEIRWSHGDDSVTYQSPIVAELLGRRQVVAASDQRVFGLDPSTGDELWSFQTAEGKTRRESAHPTRVDDDTVLITLEQESVALELSVADGAVKAEEEWRGRAFANSDVLPVVHEGKLFGFTGKILSAVNPKDGEFFWRTRDARGYGFSRVGGYLAVFTEQGELVIVEAGGDDYVEVARLKVFERGDYGDPAYADGRFYVRNQGRLAAVRVKVKEEAETEETVSGEAVSGDKS